MQSQYTLAERGPYGIYFKKFGKDSLRSDERISGSIGNRPKTGWENYHAAKTYGGHGQRLCVA